MQNNTSSKPPRWRWAVLGLIVVGALSVPTGIVFLQHRLQARPNDSARPWDDPKIAKKLADARLVKAKAIREEWRTWAVKHKTELKAMLDSQGKDFSKLQAVYKVSPPVKSKDWRPDTRSGPTKFGWFIDRQKQVANGEKIIWGDSKSAAIFETANKGIQPWLKENFSDKSDFQIAVSENAGPTETYIWASGRITEQTWIKNPGRRKGQPSVLQLPHKELAPPYDFLTSANSG